MVCACVNVLRACNRHFRNGYAQGEHKTPEKGRGKKNPRKEIVLERSCHKGAFLMRNSEFGMRNFGRHGNIVALSPDLKSVIHITQFFLLASNLEISPISVSGNSFKISSSVGLFILFKLS